MTEIYKIRDYKHLRNSSNGNYEDLIILRFESKSLNKNKLKDYENNSLDSYSKEKKWNEGAD